MASRIFSMGHLCSSQSGALRFPSRSTGRGSSTHPAPSSAPSRCFSPSGRAKRVTGKPSCSRRRPRRICRLSPPTRAHLNGFPIPSHPFPPSYALSAWAVILSPAVCACVPRRFGCGGPQPKGAKVQSWPKAWKNPPCQEAFLRSVVCHKAKTSVTLDPYFLCLGRLSAARQRKERLSGHRTGVPPGAYSLCLSEHNGPSFGCPARERSMGAQALGR